MTRDKGRLSIGAALALIAFMGVLGCAEDIKTEPRDEGLVQALFDPSLGILPTPIDLAKNPVTGLLAVPVADEETQPAQAEFDRYLNTLDGFPEASTASACFSAAVKEETLAGGIRVFLMPEAADELPTEITEIEISSPVQSAACPVLTSRSCDPTAVSPACAQGQRCVPTGTSRGQCADAGYQVQISADGPWERGRTYGFFVTDDVQAADERSVIRSALFEIAAGPNPLCVIDAESGVCTFNYSSLIASTVENSVTAENPDLDTETLEALIHETELSTATLFEGLRQQMNALLQAGEVAGVTRGSVALAWAFTVAAMVEARFDPTASVLPGPGNDLIYDLARVDGEGQPAPLVAIPGPVCFGDGECALGTCQPEDIRSGSPMPQCSTREEGEEGDWRQFVGRHSDEELGDWQLRVGLNGLDGFSTTASYYVSLTGALDPETVVAGGNLLLVNLSNAQSPLAAATFAFEAEANAITVTPDQPLDPESQYAVLMASRLATTTVPDPDGGDDLELLAKTSGGGLADSEGNRVVPSPAMALAKLRSPLVDGEGHATVSVLDDAGAAQLEPLRASYNVLLRLLEANPALGLDRDDVVMLWTFSTYRSKSFAEVLPQLRALPYLALPVLDGNAPELGGVHDPGLTGWPATVPNDNVGGFVARGSFESWNAIDPATAAFRPDPATGAPVEVPLMMTTPKGQPCQAGVCPTGFTCNAAVRCVPDAGWPLAVFQHGLTRMKADLLALANTLAGAGVATIAFDAIYHGDRSVCTLPQHCGCASNADCPDGSTCETSATHVCVTSVTCEGSDDCDGGSCNPVTSTCRAALEDADPCNTAPPFDIESNGCSTEVLADADADGRTDASGAGFLNATNPFALRDNLRSYVIDFAALLRAIKLGGAAALGGAPLALDLTQVHFVGQSLGGILGVLGIATETLSAGDGSQRGVLNVPGAPTVRIFEETPDVDFAAVIDAMLESRGLTRGSLGALQLFHTLQWVVDPGDPANFARYLVDEQLPDLVASRVAGEPVAVPAKEVIVQVATEDQVIPTARQQALAGWIGVDVADTTFPGGHGFLIRPDTEQPGLIAAGQSQVVQFLLTGQVCTPDTAAGTCEQQDQ